LNHGAGCTYVCACDDCVASTRRSAALVCMIVMEVNFMMEFSWEW